MQGFSCEQEQAVIRAVASNLASNQWAPQLQAHAESCATCRDVVRVSKALQKLLITRRPILPAASYVWWQSRTRQRRAAQRRVIQLITITQTALLAVSIMGLALWIILHRSEVGQDVRSLLNSFSAWSSSGSATGGVVLVYVSLALLVVNLLLTVRAFVTRNKSE